MEVAAEIVDSSVEIFCNSLDSGRVPEYWKTDNVTAFFKKGERQGTRGQLV